MFYLGNISQWTSEIIKTCNENKLNPIESTFMIIFFNSLDYEFVEYFQNRRPQISAFSGQNFHIFTPIIYEDYTIPDNEWEYLIKEFNNIKIHLNNRPSFILFYLEKRNGLFEPIIYSGFQIESFKKFEYHLRDIIQINKIKFDNYSVLNIELEKLLRLKSLVINPLSFTKGGFGNSIKESLNIPQIFISHSSEDKPFIDKLFNEINDNHDQIWYDEYEIKIGDNITDKINKGIKTCDIFIYIITKNSIKSDWVKYEVFKALSFEKRPVIFPILIDTTIDDIPEPFKEIQQLRFLDFSDSKKWIQNISEIKEQILRIGNKKKYSK